ncbi:MAG: insulinase family protein [Chloroflexi bacterium]|nr:insulinase family protein [Chloroflexota bacterium]
MDSVTRKQLSNDLIVHLKEIHSAPIISHWIWYRVGSRNESPGETGVSHWVEHMQFKGTPSFPPTVLDRAIAREGGVWNAFTHLDWTTYYETLPADKIDLALQLEADRMVNTIYNAAEVESERNVILAELEGNENEPLFRLGEAIQSAAFPEHPYGHEVIGTREDLLNLQKDNIYNHYRKYYTPANALIAVAGDFDTNDMLERLEAQFGSLTGGPAPEPPALPAVVQEQEKHIEITGPGDTTFLQISYHSPAANTPDFFAFSVLDSLLSGPTSLNMFGGGGISNKTSRLYRALVERELAVSAHGGLQATIDPFLYDIHITVNQQRSPREVMAAFDDEIKRLQDHLVSEQEIARAIKQARALFAYGSENITNQAFWLGYAEMFAHYDWFTHYVEHLEKVTPADVQRIAQTYLRPENRITGVYLPEKDAVGERKPGQEVGNGAA